MRVAPYAGRRRSCSCIEYDTDATGATPSRCHRYNQPRSATTGDDVNTISWGDSVLFVAPGDLDEYLRSIQATPISLHHGDLVLEIDGETVGSKAELLAAVATVFQFPDGLRQNWDSTDDWLRDLEWLPASG